MRSVSTFWHYWSLLQVFLRCYYFTHPQEVVLVPSISVFLLRLSLSLLMFYSPLSVQLLPNPQGPLQILPPSGNLSQLLQFRTTFLVFWTLIPLNICMTALSNSSKRILYFLSFYRKYLRAVLMFYMSYILHNALNILPWDMEIFTTPYYIL